MDKHGLDDCFQKDITRSYIWELLYRGVFILVGLEADLLGAGAGVV